MKFIGKKNEMRRRRLWRKEKEREKEKGGRGYMSWGVELFPFNLGSLFCF